MDETWSQPSLRIESAWSGGTNADWFTYACLYKRQQIVILHADGKNGFIV
jgi:hypothetical protein